jgi:hypothetical protein
MNARALFLLPLFALAACGNKPEGGTTSSAAPVVSAKPSATVTTSAPVPSASAAPTAGASAAPSASASAEPEAEPVTGAVHIHLESVKVLSGKNDSAERAMKLSMLQLRNKCVAPALKTTPSFEGTLKMTLEVDADGKITKASPKVTTGKIPDGVQECFTKFFQEKVQLPAGKAKVEGTILLGPKVNAK